MTNELKQILQYLESIDDRLRAQNDYWEEWKENKDRRLAKEKEEEEQREKRRTETDSMISGFMSMLGQTLVQKTGSRSSGQLPPSPPPLRLGRPGPASALQHPFRGNQWINKRRGRGRGKTRRSRRKS